jgi:hypothetical protein
MDVGLLRVGNGKFQCECQWIPSATSRDARVDLFREKEEKKKDHHRSMATQQPNVGFPTLQNPTVARPTDCPQEMASLKK